MLTLEKGKRETNCLILASKISVLLKMYMGRKKKLMVVKRTPRSSLQAECDLLGSAYDPLRNPRYSDVIVMQFSFHLSY